MAAAPFVKMVSFSKCVRVLFGRAPIEPQIAFGHLLLAVSANLVIGAPHAKEGAAHSGSGRAHAWRLFTSVGAASV